MGIDGLDAGISKRLVNVVALRSENVTHRHGSAPGRDFPPYPGIIRDVSDKVKHHLQHEYSILPEPALSLHSYEPFR
jgi:hypothetical protein